MTEPQLVLLNPGPVLLDARVRAAMGGPDVCHREPEVSELIDRIRAQLVAICGGDDRHAAVLITGSGTAAVESALTAAVQNGRVLVLDNGHYGDRLAQIATRHGLDSQVLKLAWGQPVAITELAAVLATGPRFTHLAMVQHETSTGMLNDVRAITQCAHAHGVQVILDAVSWIWLGATPIGSPVRPISV
jgi:2-aminoethylphosphonate-pyruvate transaminase